MSANPAQPHSHNPERRDVQLCRFGRDRAGNRSRSLVICAFFVGLGASVFAQQLPPAPTPAQPTTLTGCITDPDGAEVSGARVQLILPALPERTAIADGDGCFSFHDVPPGDFKLIVSARSFAPFTRPGTLHAGESLDLSGLVVSPATETTNVQVSASQVDLAEAEIKVEETQRLAGFFPNFFVTYDWHAAPLDTRQKFELSWKSTIDPANILVAGAIAGIQQGVNAFSGYGQGAQGYGKRFGANLADSAAGNMLGGAVFPMIFHQDPRYFYKGTGSIASRALYAIAASVVCRGDNGKWQPNYSGVLGNLAAGALSNLYYPAQDRNGASLTIENGLLGNVGDAVSNLLEEFVFRKITPHAPHYTPATTTP